MKLFINSEISPDALKGAILTNEHGTEFKCKGLGIEISNQNILEALIHAQEYDDEGQLIEGDTAFPLSNSDGWTIQLQPHKLSF